MIGYRPTHHYSHMNTVVSPIIIWSRLSSCLSGQVSGLSQSLTLLRDWTTATSMVVLVRMRLLAVRRVCRSHKHPSFRPQAKNAKALAQLTHLAAVENDPTRPVLVVERRGGALLSTRARPT